MIVNNIESIKEIYTVIWIFYSPLFYNITEVIAAVSHMGHMK